MTRFRSLSGRPFASRRSIFCVAFTGALFVACALSPWRPQAQSAPDANTRATGPLPPDTLAPAGDRGATYDALEGGATRVVTRFTDAVAVTERVTNGWHDTRLTDARGRTLAAFTVDRLNPAGEQLEFKMDGVTRLRVPGRADRRPTLDWGGRQAYALWKDLQRPGASGHFEWRGTLIRSREAAAAEHDHAVLEVETEWPDGFVARATRRTESRRHVKTGKTIRGTSWVGRLKRDGRTLGSLEWREEEQVLTWSFPGLTEGYLDTDRLERLGGWPFKPDAEWVNVQSLAFHRFHSAMATGQVAKQQPSRIKRLLGLALPTLHANQAGCDHLHWLDRTVFRPCCDAHDRCYEKRGCSWSSWWTWYNSWRCDQCNAAAVFCFFSGGYLLYQTP